MAHPQATQEGTREVAAAAGPSQAPKMSPEGHALAPASLSGSLSCTGSPQTPISPVTPFLPSLQGPLAAHTDTAFPKPHPQAGESPMQRSERGALPPTSLSSRKPQDTPGEPSFFSFPTTPHPPHTCVWRRHLYSEELPAPAADKPPGWVFHPLPFLPPSSCSCPFSSLADKHTKLPALPAP